MVGERPVGGVRYATEWSGGSVIKLGGDSTATAINDAGQVVGNMTYNDYYYGVSDFATEWSGGQVFVLPGLPSLPGRGAGEAFGINDAGQVVGYSEVIVSGPEPST